MKYMKLGTNPDIFYTEEATRSVLSDVPIDLIIQINTTRYLLHKFPLLLKCGLLQRISLDTESSEKPAPISLHDIPGGEDAFELCAKFCYGIAIKLSAHNLVNAIAAAKFLRMTESAFRGNLVTKLETFFETCIVHRWKDSIVTLQSVGRLPSWADEPRIVHRCLDAVVEKIITPPSKVTWSFSYTRMGYTRKQHRSAPKDWWTEDVADLCLDHFVSIISTVRSTTRIPPALIGEALHVYACKHLPDPLNFNRVAGSSAVPSDQTLAGHGRVLEAIVGMIPTESTSVSGSFLLRLLKVANYVRASASVKAELVRRSSRKLDEAAPEDLLIPMPSNPQWYDVCLVKALIENFLDQFRGRRDGDERKTRVAAILDSYLQVIACDVDPGKKFVELAESLPKIARKEHDGIYRAIDIYLKEHPEVSKAERKRLCQVIDYQRLSADTRAHAIANDRLPLRTIVQLLFIEQGVVSGSRGPTIDEPSDTRSATQGPKEDEEQQPRSKTERAVVESSVGKSQMMRFKAKIGK